MIWRARSASDKTDDWPFWYVTNDFPADSNKTLDAIEMLIGKKPVCLPFMAPSLARALAEKMNEAAAKRGTP